MISAGRLPTTRWRLRKGNQDIEDLLVRELGISPIISRIIMSREICDPDVVRRYLSPSLQDLHNPFLMQDMNKAVDRLILAIYRNEKVVVYGDYDADGITSVVVLTHFLRGIYPGAIYYIPDRITEGYGLNRDAVERFREIHRGIDAFEPRDDERFIRGEPRRDQQRLGRARIRECDRDPVPAAAPAPRPRRRDRSARRASGSSAGSRQPIAG